MGMKKRMILIAAVLVSGLSSCVPYRYGYYDGYYNRYDGRYDRDRYDERYRYDGRSRYDPYYEGGRYPYYGDGR
jgi:hypothetical protein